MFSHFSVTGDAENSAASLISWLSFISESEKRTQEIRVDYEYIYNLFIQRRVYEKRIWVSENLHTYLWNVGNLQGKKGYCTSKFWVF